MRHALQIALTVGGLCLGVPALARQGLAVLPVPPEQAARGAAVNDHGDGAQLAEKRVLEVLSRRSDLRLVRPERWRGEMRRHPQVPGIEPDNYVAGAHDLNLKAAVAVQVVTLARQRLLILDFLDPQGALLIEQAYPLPPSGPLPEATLLAMLAALPAAVDQAIGKTPLPQQERVAPLPEPAVKQAGDTENPFRVAPVPAPPPPQRPDPVLEVSLALLVGSRDLSFSDAGRPGMLWGTSPGLAVELSVAPLARLNPYVGGLTGTVHLAAFLWPALRGSDGSSFARDELRLEAGLQYRLPLPRSFSVGVSLVYGLHSLGIHDTLMLPPALDPVPPSVDYRYVAPGIEVVLPVLSSGPTARGAARLFGVELAAAYKAVLGAGAIAGSDQYGALSGGQGYFVSGGLIYRHRPFFGRLGLSVDGYSLKFDPGSTAAKRSAGAGDLYVTGALSFGVNR